MISIVPASATRYIRKWLPRRPWRATWMRAKTTDDFIPGLGAHNIRTGGKFTNRLEERIPIDTRLLRAELLRGPFDDICEIKLCGSSEANEPLLRDHGILIWSFWK